MPDKCIGITQPRLTGECWVFVDTTPATFAYNREFPSHAEAVSYAEELAASMGLPIADAGDGAAEIPFDTRQAQVNELLWLMTTIVHADELDWDGPEFWADAARQQAEMLVASAMPDKELAIGMALGAAMLRKAAEDLQVDSVDDVLPGIMIVAE